MSENRDEKTEAAWQELQSIAIAPSLPFYRRLTNPDGFWDDPAKESELRKLYAEGLSKADIQKRLGAPTRNVVIGKIRRLGLIRDSRHESTCKDRSDEPKKPRRNKRDKFSAVDFRKEGEDGFFGAVVNVETCVAPKEIDVPMEQRKMLVQLDNNHCHFPYNDPVEPDFYFCGADGADVLEHRPYCEAHMQICHQASTPRVYKPVRT